MSATPATGPRPRTISELGRDIEDAGSRVARITRGAAAFMLDRAKVDELLTTLHGLQIAASALRPHAAQLKERTPSASQ